MLHNLPPYIPGNGLIAIGFNCTLTMLHGPFLGKWFLIVVDEWLEVKLVNNATTASTTGHLRSLFAIHGLPEMIVRDNGSVFTSVEFQDFCSKNGIKHMKNAPYVPPS